MASAGNMKEVTVVLGHKQKFVKIDLDSFDNTKEAIRRKWNLTSDFEIQTLAGEKGEYYDIGDDDDLERFSSATTLTVRPMEAAHCVTTTGMPSPEHAHPQACSPPSYERSMALQPRVRGVVPLDQGDGDENRVEIVKVGREVYSLNEPPPTTSAIVKSEVRNLEPVFEIGLILDKMDVVAECLNLAYYGVVADAELHKLVQNMQFDVIKLSQILDNTVIKFRTKAGDIISDLESGFGYLLDGFEDEALESFEAIGVTSQQLRDASEKLKERIDEKSESIEGVLEHVTKQHRESMSAASDELKTSVSDKQKLIERKLRQAEEDTMTSQLRCTSLEEKEEQARREETSATKSASGFSHGLFKMLTAGFYEGDPLVAGQQDKLANIAREDLQKERKDLKEYREAEYKANEELNEFMQSLKSTKSSEDIAEKALRGAETGIKSLQASVQSAVNVWDKLHEQCESISSKGNQKLIGKLMKKKTAEERTLFWSSPTFKKQAMKFYASWVALQVICENFHRGMARVEQKLHLVIQDNPSVHEARERIPGLIEQFDKRRKESRAALEVARRQEEEQHENF